MKPGRELDALVAEKVIGLTVSRENPYSDDSNDEDYFPVDANGNYKALNPVRPYSTDIAAAWEVVEKVDLLKFDVLTKNGPNWVIADECDAGGVRGVSGEAPTAPHAICLAALKAVGWEGDGK